MPESEPKINNPKAKAEIDGDNEHYLVHYRTEKIAQQAIKKASEQNQDNIDPYFLTVENS